LWRSKQLAGCDLLKLDCEGMEVPILQRLAEAGLLAGVRLIVGEWHALDGRAHAGEGARAQLQGVLGPTHEVAFRQPLGGTEGHFSASRKIPAREN
jgi:hypothetical protein